MKRFSAYIPEELFEKVELEAKKDNRSFNQALQILLAQAINERERKRNKNKKRLPEKQE